MTGLLRLLGRVLMAVEARLMPSPTPPAAHPVRRNPALIRSALIDCEARPFGHPDFCLICEAVTGGVRP